MRRGTGKRRRPARAADAARRRAAPRRGPSEQEWRQEGFRPCGAGFVEPGGAALTNKQVAEQIGALAKQVGRIEKRLEDVDQRLTAQCGEVIRQVQEHNQRLANVERVVSRLETTISILKNKTVPDAVRPVSTRRSFQKPPGSN